MPSAKQYLESTWVKIGTGLLVVGSGPLVLVMLAAALGVTQHSNPNPVVPGVLAGLTFWPSIAMIAFGMWRVRRATPPRD